MSRLPPPHPAGRGDQDDHDDRHNDPLPSRQWHLRLKVRDERVRHTVVQVRDRRIHDEFHEPAVIEERADARERRIREARGARELERRGDGGLLVVGEERAVVGAEDRVDHLLGDAERTAGIEVRAQSVAALVDDVGREERQQPQLR